MASGSRNNNKPDATASPKGSTPADGRFAYEKLDRLLHERARLSILSSLTANPQGLSFNDLKSLCRLTDGNLSRQLSLLEESGLLEITKGIRNNRPHTTVAMTVSGRKRFSEYVGELERVVTDAAALAKPAPKGKLATQQ
jgi:DNA-binding HxlR family transcriptional regulator